MWVSSLFLAEKWGIPPWEVEELCSQNWLERAMAYYDVVAEAQAPKKKRGGLPKSKTGMEGMDMDNSFSSDNIDMGNLIIPD